jgi:hypothetical protein
MFTLPSQNKQKGEEAPSECSPEEDFAAQECHYGSQ